MRCRTLDVSSCWTYTSSQAFRFGTGGDMVDTHTHTQTHRHTQTPLTIHQRCIVSLYQPASEPASHPSPKDLTRQTTVPYIATVACSLTRIRNQRPAGVVRH